MNMEQRRVIKPFSPAQYHGQHHGSFEVGKIVIVTEDIGVHVVFKLSPQTPGPDMERFIASREELDSHTELVSGELR
jgi:hypothetical protein